MPPSCLPRSPEIDAEGSKAGRGFYLVDVRTGYSGGHHTCGCSDSSEVPQLGGEGWSAALSSEWYYVEPREMLGKTRAGGGEPGTTGRVDQPGETFPSHFENIPNVVREVSLA